MVAADDGSFEMTGLPPPPYRVVVTHEELADVIADRLNKVAGVTGTATHIAFRTYSRHDLETAFSLGLG